MTAVEGSRPLIALIAAFAFLAAASATMLNLALPFLGEALGATPASLGAVVSGYMLAFAAGAPLAGRLADRHGMRRVYLVGATMFGLSAGVAALAPNVTWVVGARVVQGLGGATMMTLGATCVTRWVPQDSRGAAMAALSAAMGVGASVGPLLGGLVVSMGSWRWALAAPLLGLPLAAVFARVVPASIDARDPGRSVDLFGATLLGLGTGAGLAALALSRELGFTSPMPWGLALLGSGALGALRVHLDRAADPIIDLSILANRRFTGSAWALAMGNAARFSLLLLVPWVLTHEAAVEAWQIGVAFAIGAVAMIAVAPFAGRWADRGAVWTPVVVGHLSMAVGCLVAGLTGATLPGSSVAMVAVGAGMAMLQTPTLAEVAGVLPAEDLAAGNGLYITGTFVGGAVGATSATLAWGAIGGEGAFLAMLVFPLLGLAGAGSLAGTEVPVDAHAVG